MSLDIALRRLASAVSDADGKPGTAPLRLAVGTVATVVLGGAADGNEAVTVTVDGTTQQAPYLDAYTPVAGALVAVLITGGAPLIIGRVVGLPNF